MSRRRLDTAAALTGPCPAPLPARGGGGHRGGRCRRRHGPPSWKSVGGVACVWQTSFLRCVQPPCPQRKFLSRGTWRCGTSCFCQPAVFVVVPHLLYPSLCGHMQHMDQCRPLPHIIHRHGHKHSFGQLLSHPRCLGLGGGEVDHTYRGAGGQSGLPDRQHGLGQRRRHLFWSIPGDGPSGGVLCLGTVHALEWYPVVLLNGIQLVLHTWIILASSFILFFIMFFLFIYVFTFRSLQPNAPQGGICWIRGSKIFCGIDGIELGSSSA